MTFSQCETFKSYYYMTPLFTIAFHQQLTYCAHLLHPPSDSLIKYFLKVLHQNGTQMFNRSN
jgi:hypothetical protein